MNCGEELALVLASSAICLLMQVLASEVITPLAQRGGSGEIPSLISGLKQPPSKYSSLITQSAIAPSLLRVKSTPEIVNSTVNVEFLLVVSPAVTAGFGWMPSAMCCAISECLDHMRLTE